MLGCNPTGRGSSPLSLTAPTGVPMKYFKPEEFSCPCCGLNFTSDKLMETVDHIRGQIGAPLFINSAWRCKKHNAELRDSSPNSLHLQGLAVDISTANLTGLAKLDLLKAGMLLFNGIGIARTFIHFDLGMRKMWVY